MASNNDFCFNASELDCPNSYSDTLCNYLPLVVFDWNCHQFEIPANMIGQIATLEIIAADCAQGAHMGYAYIDGICESCNSSTLADPHINVIDYYGCNEDTIKICGSYDLSNFCGNNWFLDQVIIPGMVTLNLKNDPFNQEFCIDVPINQIEDTSCQDYIALFYFSTPLFNAPPTFSNVFELCPNQYINYFVEDQVGNCNDNGTPLDLSDDYYYVYAYLDSLSNKSWVITRQLDSPYPNESGYHIIKTGNGKSIVKLGPFFIQEGSWVMTVNIEDCLKSFHIDVPKHCGSCADFNDYIISNVICNNKNTISPLDDTWSFELFVSHPTGSTYSINNIPGFEFNASNLITLGLIKDGCITLVLQGGPNNCISNIIVCPPKPCSTNPSCNLEVYINNLICDEETDGYYIDLSISNSNSQYLCYKSEAIGGGLNDPNNKNGNIIGSQIGPFTKEIYLTIFLCDMADCSCLTPNCYKTIYVPKIECPQEIHIGNNRDLNNDGYSELLIYPNPNSKSTFFIETKLTESEFEIFNFSKQLVFKDKFIGKNHTIEFNQPAGIYYVRYKSSSGWYKYLNILKY